MGCWNMVTKIGGALVVMLHRCVQGGAHSFWVQCVDLVSRVQEASLVSGWGGSFCQRCGLGYVDEESLKLFSTGCLYDTPRLCLKSLVFLQKIYKKKIYVNLIR